jgi:hypothetical protein
MSTGISLGYGTDITVVANYSAILALPPVTGEFYWASNSQGTSWLPGSLGGTYYNSGLYYYNGTSLEFLNVPYQATQVEVDAGTVEDKFVTPKTFTDSAQLSTIRNPIFTVELMSTLTITFYAPFDMSIDTITAIVNAPTTTIQVNESAYTLTFPINVGDEIEVTVDLAGVVNLTTTRL